MSGKLAPLHRRLKLVEIAAAYALAFSLAIGISSAQQYVLSTLAGGAPPPTPSVATADSLYPPTGLAVDAAGNVFFTSGACVFKLSPAGTLTRMVGNSRSGFSGDGGLAINSQIAADAVNNESPGGLAISPAGDLYLADSGNLRVRKISAAGIITTVAGSGTGVESGDGGPAVNAALESPAAVALDAAGDLFIADPSSGAIRKVTPDGLISTVASIGPPPTAAATPGWHWTPPETCSSATPATM